MDSGVSIALATYNGAKYLREQLESYAAQTLLPTELVVSDDGSTDATLAIIGEFAKTAPFSVRVLPPGPRLGFSDNFLRAALACEQDLIAFSDQDDVWLPDKLRIAKSFMDRDVVLSLHKSYLTDDQLSVTGILHQDIQSTKKFRPLALFPYDVGFGHTFLFRRRLLTLVKTEHRPRQPGKEHLPLSHDHWIYTLASATGCVTHINVPLCLYRQHDSNLYGFNHRSFISRIIDRCCEIAQIRSIPIWRYKLQATFYAELALALRCANSAPGLDDHIVAKAAAVYEHRSHYMLKRIALFEERDFPARLAMYPRLTQIAALSGYSASSLILAHLKLISFGVIRFGKLEYIHE